MWAPGVRGMFQANGLPDITGEAASLRKEGPHSLGSLSGARGDEVMGAGRASQRTWGGKGKAGSLYWQVPMLPSKPPPPRGLGDSTGATAPLLLQVLTPISQLKQVPNNKGCVTSKYFFSQLIQSRKRNRH